MNVEFANVLAVTKAQYNTLSAKGVNKITISGIQIFPIGYAIPCIQKGNTCLANARIEKFEIVADGFNPMTTVYFKLESIDRESSEKAYKAYKAQSSKENSDYEGTDKNIPGIYSGSNRHRDEDDWRF